MAEGPDERECPNCGYETLVFDDDGHVPVCPECGQDGLFRPADASKIRTNRLQASGVLDGVLSAEQATDAIIAPTGTTDDETLTAVDGVPVIETDHAIEVETTSDSLTRERLKEMVEDAQQRRYEAARHSFLELGDDDG